MRRIKVILGAVAAVAAMMVLAAPAMAQEVEGGEVEVGDVDFVSGECVFIDEFGFLTNNCFDNGDDTELVIGDGSADFSIEGGSGSIQSVNQVDSTSGGDIEFNNGGSSSGGSGNVGNQQGVTQSGGGSGGDIKLG
jgi:hypothetical protein